jgi:PadR family transcriptional regulator AphA
MEYRLVTSNTQTYLECLPGSGCLASEADALELVAACGENRTDNLLFYADNLTEDFYHLESGLAGKILLKFSIYRLRVAAVLTPDLVNKGRFREMASETNRGNQFRIFFDRESAEQWLVGH